MGRNTQGVRLINLREGDSIAAATQVPANNGESEEEKMDQDDVNTESGENNENP